MIARALLLTALVVSVGFTAGCGRAPGVEDVFEETTASAIPVKPNPNAKRPVIVEGRVYLEGEAPAPFKMPEAAAPEEGKGHLRAAVNVKDVSPTSTGAVSISVMHGEENVFAKIWEPKELNVSTVAAIAENLAPGEYEIVMNRYNKAMGIYAQKRVAATVKAGETADVRF
jgi:hypothetical protein